MGILHTKKIKKEGWRCKVRWKVGMDEIERERLNRAEEGEWRKERKERMQDKRKKWSGGRDGY